MQSREVSPWVRAFWEEMALPSVVRGPVESWALAVLAASWAGETLLGHKKNRSL